MKRQLKVETPYGVFTRNTSRNYQYVVIWKNRYGGKYFDSWHHTRQLAENCVNYAERVGIYEVPQRKDPNDFQETQPGQTVAGDPGEDAAAPKDRQG